MGKDDGIELGALEIEGCKLVILVGIDDDWVDGRVLNDGKPDGENDDAVGCEDG